MANMLSNLSNTFQIFLGLLFFSFSDFVPLSCSVRRNFMSHRENSPLRNIDNERCPRIRSLEFDERRSRGIGDPPPFIHPRVVKNFLSSAALAITHFRHCHSLTLRAPRLRPSVTTKPITLSVASRER